MKRLTFVLLLLLLIGCNKEVTETEDKKITIHLMYTNGNRETIKVSDGDIHFIGDGTYFVRYPEEDYDVKDTL